MDSAQGMPKKMPKPQPKPEHEDKNKVAKAAWLKGATAQKAELGKEIDNAHALLMVLKTKAEKGMISKAYIGKLTSAVGKMQVVREKVLSKIVQANSLVSEVWAKNSSFQGQVDESIACLAMFRGQLKPEMTKLAA